MALFRRRSIAAATALSVLITAVVAVHDAHGYSPDVVSNSVELRVSIEKMHPGTTCRVWVAESEASPARKYEGSVKSCSKDQVVLITGISEGRNEYRVPVLGYLPYVGKYFTRVDIGREEITARIPVDKITKIEELDARSAAASNR